MLPRVHPSQRTHRELRGCQAHGPPGRLAGSWQNAGLAKVRLLPGPCGLHSRKTQVSNGISSPSIRISSRETPDQTLQQLPRPVNNQQRPLYISCQIKGKGFLRCELWWLLPLDARGRAPPQLPPTCRATDQVPMSLGSPAWLSWVGAVTLWVPVADDRHVIVPLLRDRGCPTEDKGTSCHLSLYSQA